MLTLRYIRIISSPEEPATTAGERGKPEARAGGRTVRCSCTRQDARPGSRRRYAKRFETRTVVRCCHEGRTKSFDGALPATLRDAAARSRKGVLRSGYAPL